MSQMQSEDELRTAVMALQQRYHTLLLSSLDNHHPELSYAPYCCDQQGRFYVYLSGLASHSQNLERHPDCSVMFIADESDSRNLFARERLSYRCRAERIEPQAPDHSIQLDQLQQRFGEVMTLLRTLPDFQLYRLTPLSGRYVVGFGRAYDVDPQLHRITPVGPPSAAG